MTLTLPPSATAGQFSLILDNAGDEALTISSFDAFLEEPPGTRLPVDLRIALPGESATLTSLALAAKTQRRLVLHAIGLPPALEYRGWLVLTIGGRQRYHSLVIQRSAPAQLTLLGQKDGKLGLQVASMPFARKVVLQSGAAQPAVTDLEVSLGPLEREDGAPLGPATLGCLDVCDGEQHAIAPGSTLAFELAGDGLERTKYLATLFLGYQGKTDATTLEVTRGPARQNLELAAVRAAQDDSGWGSTPSGLIEFRVRETLGVTTAIAPPNLDFWRVEGAEGAGKKAAGERRVELSRRECSGGDWVSGGGTTLAALECAAYRFRVTGLAAGTYAGEVSVSSADSARVTGATTLTVRAPWLRAFLVILLGVAVSYRLYTWSRWGRDREFRAASLARERGHLANVYNAEDELWRDLRERLANLQRDNRVRQDLVAADFEAGLDSLRTRRRLYVDGLTVKSAIERLLAGFPSELATQRQAHERDLNEVFGGLRSALGKHGDQGLDCQKPEDAPGRIAALREMFGQARKDAILVPARRLAKALEKLATETGAAGDLGEETSLALSRVREIVEQVEQGGDPVAFAGRLAQARLEYGDLRRRQLLDVAAQLRRQRRAAPDASDEDWAKADAHLARAGDELDAAERSLAGNEPGRALGRLIVAARELLFARIEQLAVLSGPTGKPLEVEDGRWERLRRDSRVGGRLDEARAALERGKDDQSRRRLGEAETEFVRLLAWVVGDRVKALGARADGASRPPEIDAGRWDAAFAEAPLSGLAAGVQSIEDKLVPLLASPDGGALALVRADLGKVHGDLLLGLEGLLEAEIAGLPKEAAESYLLTAFGTKRRQAEGALASYARTADESALAEAEDALAGADGLYKQICDELGRRRQGQGPMSLEKARGADRRAGATRGALAQAAIAVPGVGRLPTESEIDRLEPGPLPDERSEDEIYRGVERNQHLASLAVMVVAAISGVLALWVPNATFGTFADHVGAFLWGFGLDAASKVFLELGAKTGVVPSER